MKAYFKKLVTLSPLKITAIYLFVASLWIVITDYLLFNGIAEGDYLYSFQTYKGLFYVFITSLGLYLLIEKYADQLLSQEKRLQGMRAEQRSDQELINLLFERIPVFIAMYDPELEEIKVNREFERVTGWSNEDAQKTDLLKACFPDLEQRKEAAEFVNNPGIGWKEFEIQTKSGKQLQTSWTTVRLTDETSVGIGIDMTEIKASQARLRESRELLRNMFESLEESVILVEPGTRQILDCNHATEKIFGYNKEELIGQSTKMLHRDREYYEEFDDIGEKALMEKGSFQAEFMMKKKSGELFHSDHTVTLVYDQDGETDKVVSVIRDITDKKRAREQIISSIIEGEDRERKRIARELHDGVGQYLSAANMNLEAAKKETDRLSPKKETLFYKGLHLVKQSINEVRNISHNIMPQAIEDYGLVMAVEALIENYGNTTDVKLEFAHDVNDDRLSEQQQLNIYRIIQEAVNNAIRYAECSKITIHLLQEDEKIFLKIMDNGIGDNYYDRESKKGLGLKSIRSRTKALSASIEFDSTPGEGAVISLWIPIELEPMIT